MGRKKNPDTFDKWVRDGVWPKVRDLIKKLKQNGFTNKYICERLGITEATFIGLYNNHVEIREVFYEFLQNTGLSKVAVIKRSIPYKLMPTLRDKTTGKFTKLDNPNCNKVYPNEYIIIMQK